MKQNKTLESGRWNDEEHRLFLSGLERYGRNWKQLEKCIPNRSSSQIRSHAQKYFQKLGKREGLKDTMGTTDSSSIELSENRRRLEMEEFLAKYQEAKAIENTQYNYINSQSFFAFLNPMPTDFLKNHVDLDRKRSQQTTLPNIKDKSWARIPSP